MKISRTNDSRRTDWDIETRTDSTHAFIITHQPAIKNTLFSIKYTLMSQFSPQVATQTLSQAFGHLSFETDKLLGPLTTVGIGGPADIFVEVTSSKDFAAVVKRVRKENWPLFILGWGSNTLISDEGIRGVVIKNKSSEIEVLESNEANSVQTSSTKPRWSSDKDQGLSLIHI